MISFSTEADIRYAEQRLYRVWPGLLKSLEKEHITLFPKVATRLANARLAPRTIRNKGKIKKINMETNK
jgi:hypothetical protein